MRLDDCRWRRGSVAGNRDELTCHHLDCRVRLRHRAGGGRGVHAARQLATATVEDRLAMLTGTNQAAKQAKDSAAQRQRAGRSPGNRSPSFVEVLVSRFNLRLLFEQADTHAVGAAILGDLGRLAAWWAAWPASCCRCTRAGRCWLPWASRAVAAVLADVPAETAVQASSASSCPTRWN